MRKRKPYQTVTATLAIRVEVTLPIKPPTGLDLDSSLLKHFEGWCQEDTYNEGRLSFSHEMIANGAGQIASYALCRALEDVHDCCRKAEKHIVSAIPRDPKVTVESIKLERTLL